MTRLWPAALLACAPFLFLPYGFDAREVPRAALVFVVAAVLVARGRVTLDRWSAPWLLACVLVPLATPAPLEESLLGALPTSQGTLLWLAYGLVLAASVQREERVAWRWLAAAITLAQAAVAAAQLVGGAPVTGTLGHPVFLGAWGALGAAVASGLVADSEGRRRWLALAASFAGVACVVLAARRGPLLMLVVALAGMGLLLRPRRWLAATAAVVGFVALLALVPRAELGGGSALDRWLLRAGDAQETTSSRLSTFQGTATLIAARPWLGYGPSSFADYAAAWTPPGDSHYEARPHNLGLLVAFSLGVPAALALVLFLASIVRRAMRAGVPVGERGSFAAALLVGPAYAVHLAVNVDQPALGLWVCALVAGAAGSSVTRSPKGLSRVAALAGAAALVIAGLLPVLGSVALDAAQRLAAGGRLDAADRAHRLAHATGSTGCLALRSRASLARWRDAGASAVERAAWMKGCLERHPTDRLARHHYAVALGDSGEIGAAIRELEAVLAEVPGLEESQLELASLLAADGQIEHAVQALHPERARPPMRAPMWRLRGQLYEALQDRQSAIYAYEQALRWGPDDAELRGRVAELRGL